MRILFLLALKIFSFLDYKIQHILRKLERRYLKIVCPEDWQELEDLVSKIDKWMRDPFPHFQKISKSELSESLDTSLDCPSSADTHKYPKEE